MEKITTFKDVFEWIIYDWDSHYDLTKDTKGNFYVNKLYIEPHRLTYKMETFELAPNVFNRVSKLYDLLQETKLNKVLNEED